MDKAQEHTIPNLVIDSYNFWKPTQFGVDVGCCTCADGLQIQNFNMMAATLKHLDIVLSKLHYIVLENNSSG